MHDLDDNDVLDVCTIQDDYDTYTLDLNGDGQFDAYGIDTTGSGNIDTIYIDSDGDGQANMVQHDGNLDGLPDAIGLDSNGNGQIDTVYLDTGGDGIFDVVINAEQDLSAYEASSSSLDHHGIEGLDDTSAQADSSVGKTHLFTKAYDLDGDGQISYMEVPTNSTHVGNEPFYDDSYGIMPPQFDVNSGEDGVIGHPADDIDHWHMQSHEDTCAVVSQEFILEELTGKEFNEDELMHIAEERGWYTPGGGTTIDNVGNLLEYYGIDVERGSGTIESLQTALANGDKVIVGLDSDEIWSNGIETTNDQIDSVMGIPDNDANHAVEVIGIDNSDPQHPMVILNDPGHPGGQGSMIAMELFRQSWADSGNFMMIASK